MPTTRSGRRDFRVLAPKNASLDPVPGDLARAADSEPKQRSKQPMGPDVLPPSRIPASIEFSIKLFVCLDPDVLGSLGLKKPGTREGRVVTSHLES